MSDLYFDSYSQAASVTPPESVVATATVTAISGTAQTAVATAIVAAASSAGIGQYHRVAGSWRRTELWHRVNGGWYRLIPFVDVSDPTDYGAGAYGSGTYGK